jgi:hypothetical protein
MRGPFFMFRAALGATSLVLQASRRATTVAAINQLE